MEELTMGSDEVRASINPDRYEFCSTRLNLLKIGIFRSMQLSGGCLYLH